MVMRQNSRLTVCRLASITADIGNYEITGQYATIVATGLLMFFQRDNALSLLADIQEHVAAQGLATLTCWPRTSLISELEAGNYYLFGQSELEDRFKG